MSKIVTKGDALDQLYDRWSALYTRKHGAGQFAPFTSKEQNELTEVNEAIKRERATRHKPI